MPKFSIITVCFNEAANIRKTLDSIVNQTFTDYELIVVDGGSTDGSKELIAQYGRHIKWWCSEPDSGTYNAMNKGVMHATGEYVNFMNAGDRFYDLKVLETVSQSQLDADVIEGYVVDSRKHVHIREKSDDLCFHLFADTLSHQGSFIRRELLLSHPYDERYSIVADWKFWLETLFVARHTYAFIDLDIAYYDTAGISGNPETVWKERERVVQEMFPPHIVQLIHSYQDAYRLAAVQYTVWLDKHSPKGYQLIRKIAKRVVKAVKKLHSK